MHTEEQARKLWCPMARQPAGSMTTDAAINDETQLRKGRSHCIASDCAMWRWYGTQPPRGFCGLAGRA